MVVALFFLIGVFLLKAFSPDQLALVWATAGSPRFFLNLITHMFAHANWGHLMGNYMFVLPYALYLEFKVGWKAFVKIWLACGFGALALYALTLALGEFHSGVIGSSGAAFGICTAALWLVDFNRFAKYFCRIVISYHLFMQGFLAYLALTNPLFAFFSGIAYAAHLGGALAGILAAVLVRRSLKRQLSK
jgi:uncharacterized protein